MGGYTSVIQPCQGLIRFIALRLMARSIPLCVVSDEPRASLWMRRRISMLWRIMRAKAVSYALLRQALRPGSLPGSIWLDSLSAGMETLSLLTTAPCISSLSVCRDGLDLHESRRIQ